MIIGILGVLVLNINVSGISGVAILILRFNGSNLVGSFKLKTGLNLKSFIGGVISFMLISL